MTNNLTNIADLRSKKESLLQRKQQIESEVKEDVKNNLLLFKNVIHEFCEEQDDFDARSCIIAIASYRIKEMHNVCKKEIMSNMQQYVITRSKDLLCEIDEMLKVLYSLDKLQEKICKKKNACKRAEIDVQNDKKDVNYTSMYTIRNYDNIQTFTINMNIRDCVCRMYDNDTILTENKVNNCTWKYDSMILDYFADDFCYDLDILDLNNEMQKRKLKMIVYILINTDIDIKQLYTGQIQNNDDKLLADCSILNARTKKQMQQKIHKFVTNVIEKKKDAKTAGLIISHLFVLCPGLIELFDHTKYEKMPEFYFFAWIRYKEQHI